MSGQRLRLFGGGSDLDCFGRGHAGDAVLDGRDCDEPGTGLFQADGAGRGALLGLLVGGDFAGAARGSRGASFDASGRIARGGDCVGRVGGCGKAAGDWLVGGAFAGVPANFGGGAGCEGGGNVVGLRH